MLRLQFYLDICVYVSRGLSGQEEEGHVTPGSVRIRGIKEESVQEEGIL